MPWDENERVSQIRIEPDRQEAPKAGDPLFSRKETTRPRRFKFPEEMPGGLIAVVILALVVLFILFIPNSKRAETDKKFVALEDKVTRLSERMTQVEELGKGIISLEVLDQKNEQFKNRLDRVEASLSMVTKQMEEKLAALKPPTPKGVSQKPIPEKKETQPAQEKVAFHIVQPGDTIYSISRRYAMKPEELKQLNQLSGEQIYPGQKLQVRGK